MKNKFTVLLVYFSLFYLYSCTSTESSPVALDIQSKDKQEQVQSLYWTGNGGKGMSIAILPPKATGLAKNQDHLPVTLQGELVSNFSTYSAISVLDRVRLDEQYSELLSGYYNDNAEVSLDLGHLSPTDYILGGNITKISTRYALQMSITRTTDKMTIASYSETLSIEELENFGGIRRVSLDLLQKMGVQPTERTITELSKAAEVRHINAQTTLAQGITALKQGTVVEALSYFIQASDYDPSLAEAASRMNILNANISSGNIGADTRNEIAWRRQWIERLQEAENFFVNYVKEPQPYYLIYSTDIQKENINWQNETVTLSILMELHPETSWINPINGVISAVKNGFQSTGKAKTWEIDFPAKSAAGRATPIINKTGNYTVIVEIINDTGKSIGRQTITIPYGYEIKDGIITKLKQWQEKVLFRSIKVDEKTLTDTLNIRIISIDGVITENASKQKNISIMPITAYNKMITDRTNARITAGQKWNIGDYGPANGFVFYDKGNYNDGWRYLETVPYNLGEAEWGLRGMSLYNTQYKTSALIGSGKQNTEGLLVMLNRYSETNMAAQLCKEYTFSGYNDWFLPSKFELDLIYILLKQKELVENNFESCWSSSEWNEKMARKTIFDDRYFRSLDTAEKTEKNSVRAARVF